MSFVLNFITATNKVVAQLVSKSDSEIKLNWLEAHSGLTASDTILTKSTTEVIEQGIIGSICLPPDMCLEEVKDLICC